MASILFGNFGTGLTLQDSDPAKIRNIVGPGSNNQRQFWGSWTHFCCVATHFNPRQEQSTSIKGIKKGKDSGVVSSYAYSQAVQA